MMTLKELKIRVGDNVGSKSGKAPVNSADCLRIAEEWCKTHKATLAKLKGIALEAAKKDDPAKALADGINADKKLAKQLEDMDGQDFYHDLTDPDFAHVPRDVQRAYLKVLAQLA